MSDQTRLDRFISSFKNEAELRTAMVGLLEQMPNTSNVRMTHGPQEKGKDIVFHYAGPFEERRLIACVIKNEQITGSAESAQGARTVYIQAEQALDSTIANPANGIEERVAQVFVISPYDCPPATVESISGKLTNRPGQVTFICGHQLLDNFDKYYPEFLLFQSALYGSYIAELEKGLSSDPAVSNALFRHGFVSGPKTLTALYVRPKFLRELHRADLQVSLPDERVLLGPFTYHEVGELQKSFLEVGRLVAAITMPSEEGATLQGGWFDLANAVKRGWKVAFDRHRQRTDISVEERNQPRNVISLYLEDREKLDSTEQELLAPSKFVIEGFRKTLESANLCAEFHFANAKDAMRSDLLLAYCQVEGVAKQVPSVVRMQDAYKQILEMDDTLIDSPGIGIFITGPAGFGKTSFCKWQTVFDLKRLKEGESTVIPIYIPLHQHSQGELGSFESTFLRATEIIALWEQRRDRSSGKPTRMFRLYLDGLAGC
jgi:hypothetical protein